VRYSQALDAFCESPFFVDIQRTGSGPFLARRADRSELLAGFFYSITRAFRWRQFCWYERQGEDPSMINLVSALATALLPS
jgi:hypothetical protein